MLNKQSGNLGTDRTIARTMAVNIKSMAHVCSNTFSSIFLKRDIIVFWKMSLLHSLTKLIHQTIFREKTIGEALWRRWHHEDWTLKTVSERAFWFTVTTWLLQIVIRTWFTKTILEPIIIVIIFITIIAVAVLITLLLLLSLSLWLCWCSFCHYYWCWCDCPCNCCHFCNIFVVIASLFCYFQHLLCIIMFSMLSLLFLCHCHLYCFIAAVFRCPC